MAESCGTIAVSCDPNATDAFSRINARSAPTRQNRLARCALVVYYFDLFINHLPGETVWFGCEVVGRGKIVSGRPERITSSEQFCIGVVEVTVAIFATNTRPGGPIPI